MVSIAARLLAGFFVSAHEVLHATKPVGKNAKGHLVDVLTDELIIDRLYDQIELHLVRDQRVSDG